MKINSLVKSASLVALLGAAVSAHAAGITFNGGDLLLGFQDPSNSIQFNLTNVSTLNAKDGLTHLVGNVNTALSYTGGVGATGYGAGWATNSGVLWSVAGRDASSSIFYGAMEGTVAPLATLSGSAATANYPLYLPSNAGTAASSLTPIYTAMNSMSATVSLKAGGSTILAAKYANNGTGAIGKIAPNSASGTGYGAFVNPNQLNTSVTNSVVGTAGVLAGKTYSAMDLYSFADAGGGVVTPDFLGTIALVNDGSVYFTSSLAAIPEPSTYAAILGVATLGFAALRRRKQALIA